MPLQLQLNKKKKKNNNNNVIEIRGVSDVGFPLFADTDLAFYYPRISDADITYFIILGLWKWVSATDDEEISENYAVIKLMNEWKCN